MDKRLTVVSTEHSYLNHLLYELRDQEIQQDRLRFRMNLERVGEILAYELSKELNYHPQRVITPLGELDIPLLDQQPVIISILRAGLPLHQGFLRLFDRAENGFISAYRHHTSEQEFVVKVEYQAMPAIENKSLIIVDPMIATGRSVVLSVKEILEFGQPKDIFIVGVVASDEGLDYVKRHIPRAKIFVGAVDHELTAKAYIVPGLGDAGDLAFGPKE
ncbi:MAG: uracil phosphoribosyltransferase [Bacteroidota bacterium]